MGGCGCCSFGAVGLRGLSAGSGLAAVIGRLMLHLLKYLPSYNQPIIRPPLVLTPSIMGRQKMTLAHLHLSDR